MKLIDVVMAHIAAEEMSSLNWPYDLALALVKVKRATADETAFFVSKERALALEYAALDEFGNMRLTPRGTFIFKEPSKADEYERVRRELADTDAGEHPPAFRVKPPTEIRPAWVEALEGFIEFSG